MGLWKDLKNKRGSRGGIWFLPQEDGSEAHYRVKILRAFADKDRKGVDMVVVETVCLESDHPVRKAGSQPSVVIKLDKDAAWGNVADIVRVGLSAMAARDNKVWVDPAEVDFEEDDVDELLGEGNPLEGLEFNVTAFNKPTREGKDFTRLYWDIPEDVQAAVKAA